MSGALRTVRDDIVAALVSETAVGGRLAGMHISAHGGDFGLKDLQRYAKQAPHVVVALLSAGVDNEAGSVMVESVWGLIVIEHGAPGDERKGAVIDRVDAVLRTLYWRFVSTTITHGRIRDVAAKNEYTPELDAFGIALWSIQLVIDVELVDVDTSVDLRTIHVEYDLAPRPDGEELGDVVEAIDQIDLPPGALNLDGFLDLDGLLLLGDS